MSLFSFSWRPKGTLLALLILGWVSYVHLAGTYLFTQGFLLTRMALPDINTCNDSSCNSLQTHKKLVLLIIDALRFDFISPDPPIPSSPFHHNVLTLPRELSSKYPTQSFIFNSFSDPPTTTLQRIKGITTGSLPTFVDIGSSFGGSSVDEDSFIGQLHEAGKKVAFMGDDTWMTVFPTLLAPNMTFPYDSFNVEDLHTVDEGVIRHLFPLLKDKSGSWDAIIGHFLGVDHVAHRVGPDHPTMKEKLLQMDHVLREVVDALDEDTLLVVLGDHGMDRKGDHGGDDVFETSAALWMYSKGVPLQDEDLSSVTTSDILPKTTYPEAPSAHRSIQQIDIVPTLSLLLGLPIPFNNLGSIIPEAFSRRTTEGENALRSALNLNARQIQQYLNAYHTGTHGNELNDAWSMLESEWEAASSSKDPQDGLSKLFHYTRASLEACRSLWARFNVVEMLIGLFILALSVISVTVLYLRLSSVVDWENWASKRVDKMAQSFLLGLAASPVVYVTAGKYFQNMGIVNISLAITSTTSCVTLLVDGLPSLKLPQIKEVPLILVVHALCFLSNSFTFWEDRILTFFLLSSLLPSTLTALTSPDGRLRRRILLFSGVYAACIRLMAISTVCREEQQPYCHVTFYASAQVSSSPLATVLLSIPAAIVIPTIIRRILAISASDKGLVPNFLRYVLRPALVAGSICWILEWAETADAIGLQDVTLLRTLRTLIARVAFYGIFLGGVTYWWLNPLCIELRVSEPKTPGEKPKAVVVVNSNAYGASYLLFWTLIFSLVYLTSQLPGQIALLLTLVALLAHLEIADSVRDVQGINEAFEKAKLSAAMDLDKARAAPFNFNQLIPLALLGLHAFFATGHQATLSSMQWKTGFLLTPVVSYFTSPLTITLNTFGPIIVTAAAAPLIALWQLPVSLSGSGSPTGALGASVRACIGVMQYFAVLLLSSATSAAVLRRHLMVWKVFAPRFMAAAVGLVGVDLVLVVVAVGLGVHRSTWRLGKLVEGMEQHGRGKETGDIDRKGKLKELGASGGEEKAGREKKD